MKECYLTGFALLIVIGVTVGFLCRPVSMSDEINTVYRDAVVRLGETGYLPDETYCYVSDGGSFEEQKQRAYPNQIAVSDINNDGEKELLILIGGTCNSDFAQYVYGYSKENECFTLLFSYYAGYKFYSNGLIYAPVSHSAYLYNDDFWPYEVYEYNNQTKQYECIAGVEELDLGAVPEYEDSFPYEYDRDGDGKIYPVNYRGENFYLDEDEYFKWKNELLCGDVINLTWYSLDK